MTLSSGGDDLGTWQNKAKTQTKDNYTTDPSVHCERTGCSCNLHKVALQAAMSRILVPSCSNRSVVTLHTTGGLAKSHNIFEMWETPNLKLQLGRAANLLGRKFEASLILFAGPLEKAAGPTVQGRNPHSAVCINGHKFKVNILSHDMS